MIPDDRTENLEPPDCNTDDSPVMCDQCFAQAEDECTLCAECQREADAINGIYENGTEETVKISLPKFKTTDGRGTCGLDFAHDHLRCPLIRSHGFGYHYACAWTGHAIFPDKSDGSGYLRPCENCPIHKSP
jgi:hypothetical protein